MHSCLPNKGPSPHPIIADLSIPTFEIDNLDTHWLKCFINQPDPDKINAIVLKEAGEVTVPILYAIFHCSLQSGIVPKDVLEASKIWSLYTKRKLPTSFKLQTDFSH